MRVYQLARGLGARHDVTVLSYIEPGRHNDVEGLREHADVVVVERGATPRSSKRLAQLVSVASPSPFASRAVHSVQMQRAIEDLCSRTAFDLVQLESSVLCGFRLPRGPRLILDEHNVEYEVFERMHEGERSLPRRAFSRLEYMRFRTFEQAAWRYVDGCAVTSVREAEIVRSHAAETPIAVVPNGVDLAYFRPADVEPARGTAVFNGVLDYRPNLDAAYYLVDEVWPLVAARYRGAALTIVGRASPAVVRRLQRPGVTVAGEVADVRPYLADASVVLVPIRMGGGTRLKVVEGLAMGKAMVSTSLGCEGVDVRDGEHLLVADAPPAFAAAVVRLLEDAELARALGSAGRARMEEQYSWELACERIEELYSRVLQRRRSAETGPAPASMAATPRGG